MRQYFNDWGYAQRVEDGEFVAFVFGSHPPGPNPPDNLQDGALSEEIHYFDRRLRRRAIVHQYTQPDGTIGASGLPDPKWLMGDDGTLYRLEKQKKPPASG